MRHNTGGGYAAIVLGVLCAILGVYHTIYWDILYFN